MPQSGGVVYDLVALGLCLITRPSANFPEATSASMLAAPIAVELDAAAAAASSAAFAAAASSSAFAAAAFAARAAASFGGTHACGSADEDDPEEPPPIDLIVLMEAAERGGMLAASSILVGLNGFFRLPLEPLLTLRGPALLGPPFSPSTPIDDFLCRRTGFTPDGSAKPIGTGESATLFPVLEFVALVLVFVVFEGSVVVVVAVPSVVIPATATEAGCA